MKNLKKEELLKLREELNRLKPTIINSHPSNYEFECNISNEYSNNQNCDVWGAAFLWGDDDNLGVEYNFCIDSGTNSSAIYKMQMKDEYMETDYSTFIHYEIDFSKEDWQVILAQSMIQAYKKFHLSAEAN